MNPHHTRLPAFVLVVLAFTGCSNQASRLTGPAAPATESSRLAPGLPPIEQSSPPRIRVWTDDGWREAQKEGGVSLEADKFFVLEISEQQAVTLHWSAQPAGQTIGYRWAVDLYDITDETPRIDDSDIAHWSAWSGSETSATFGPLAAGRHVVFIEARTKVGFVSLFPIRLQVVSASDPAISQAGAR